MKKQAYLSISVIIILMFGSCREEIPPEVFEPGDGPYLTEMAENLYFVEDYNNGGNICFLVSDEGVLVVDAGNYPGPTSDVASLIGKVTDQPIKTIIYTHCHGDHVGGVAGWPEDAEIIAHKNLPANLDKFVIPGVEEFRQELEKYGEDSLSLKYGDSFEERMAMKIRKPDEVFSEIKILEMGKYPVELHYPGTCHTTDNIIVWFPDHKLVHTGDLVFHNRHPFISKSYEADAYLWLETLKEWSDKDIEKVIPGHGEPGGKELLDKQGDYLAQLILAVEEYADSELDVYEMAPEIHAEYFTEYEYSGFFDIAVETVLEDVIAEYEQ